MKTIAFTDTEIEHNNSVYICSGVAVIEYTYSEGDRWTAPYGETEVELDFLDIVRIEGDENVRVSGEEKEIVTELLRIEIKENHHDKFN